MYKNIPKMIKSENGVLVESSEVRSFYAHVHNYSEIILYEAFDGVVYIGDTAFKVDEHTAVLIYPSDIHRILVNDSLNAKYIKICVDLGVGFSGENSSYVLSNLKSDDFLVTLFKRMLDATDDTYRSLLVNLITYHLTKYGKRLSVNVSGKKTIIDALKYVNENFAKQISLVSCANHVSVTAEHLSKIFSLTTGITFTKYLTNVRINKACELLLNTDKSVTEICYDCGYGNLSHFLRVFTKIKGVSPLQYKKRETNYLK